MSRSGGWFSSLWLFCLLRGSLICGCACSGSLNMDQNLIIHVFVSWQTHVFGEKLDLAD